MFIEVIGSDHKPTMVNVDFIREVTDNVQNGAILWFSPSSPEAAEMVEVKESYEEVQQLIYGATNDPRYRKPTLGRIDPVAL